MRAKLIIGLLVAIAAGFGIYICTVRTASAQYATDCAGCVKEHQDNLQTCWEVYGGTSYRQCSQNAEHNYNLCLKRFHCQ